MSVQINDLSVVYKNGVKAVNHINLEIGPGIYGLLGENGAGKTTLMRVLSTILKPSGGTVFLSGLPYQEKNYEKIQSKIGYLPQELNLYPSLNIMECLSYMGELSGIPKTECRNRIRYYLEKTSLTEHRKKKIRQLSGGMKRRVGLIQALLGDPEFLIVDEPTAGLDPEERIRIRNLLVDLSRDRSVLFSTHVVEDLAAVCSQLAVMKQGSILYSGSAAKLMQAADGHIWSCICPDEAMAHKIEQTYHVTSKLYTKQGMKLKLISSRQPDIPCERADVSLEDAYIYLTITSQPPAGL